MWSLKRYVNSSVTCPGPMNIWKELCPGKLYNSAKSLCCFTAAVVNEREGWQAWLTEMHQENEAVVTFGRHSTLFECSLTRMQTAPGLWMYVRIMFNCINNDLLSTHLWEQFGDCFYSGGVVESLLFHWKGMAQFSVTKPLMI